MARVPVEATDEIKARLEELRAAIDAENISYGELSELQNLAPYVEAHDVQLLEWAGVPEYADSCTEPSCEGLTDSCPHSYN